MNDKTCPQCGLVDVGMDHDVLLHRVEGRDGSACLRRQLAAEREARKQAQADAKLAAEALLKMGENHHALAVERDKLLAQCAAFNVALYHAENGLARPDPAIMSIVAAARGEKVL